MEPSAPNIPELIKENILILSLLCAGIIFLSIGLIQMFSPKEQKVSFQDGQIAEAAEQPKIMVDVAGQVQKPGVYSLPSSARIQDALIAAGGLSAEADRNYIAQYMNLAAKVTDGSKLYFPRANEQVAGSDTSFSGSTNALININTASAAQLDELPGVGEVTAGKIIDGRPYSSIEELQSKKVVNTSTFEKIKNMISVY